VDVLPKLVQKVQPTYPELVRQSRVEGSVILQVVLTREGTVRSPQILRCSGSGLDERVPAFDAGSPFCDALVEAAVAAVSQWRYEPARRAGEPVEVFFTIKVDFELE
jgi:protein TonB